MNALRVHGGGAVLDRTSCSVGLRGQYGPVGIARLSGLEGRKSPDDMNPSSSASQSERTDEQRGEVSRDVCTYSEGGFRCFDLRIALRRYFMGTQVVRLSFSHHKRIVMPIQTRELWFLRGWSIFESARKFEELNIIATNTFVDVLADSWQMGRKECRPFVHRFSDPAVEFV
jgi:hypothetical protein